jgi:hypothetical protein
MAFPRFTAASSLKSGQGAGLLAAGANKTTFPRSLPKWMSQPSVYPDAGEVSERTYEPRRSLSLFFGRDRGMVFFVAFLTLTTIVLPSIPLSHAGRLAISVAFALTLIFGSFTTIHHRIVIYLVPGLTLSAVIVDQIVEFGHWYRLLPLDTTLKLACLSVLVVITVKRAFRPGRVTGYRVLGGIAGYLLIGYTWSFAYQLLLQKAPGAIHFDSGMVDTLSRQPRDLIYLSFTTLTTVGYGDVHPVHPIARSLAVAEALTGQLYLAILIASLVGMALQARPAIEEVEKAPSMITEG